MFSADLTSGCYKSFYYISIFPLLQHNVTILLQTFSKIIFCRAYHYLPQGYVTLKKAGQLFHVTRLFPFMIHSPFLKAKHNPLIQHLLYPRYSSCFYPKYYLSH